MKILKRHQLHYATLGLMLACCSSILLAQVARPPATSTPPPLPLEFRAPVSTSQSAIRAQPAPPLPAVSPLGTSPAIRRFPPGVPSGVIRTNRSNPVPVYIPQPQTAATTPAGPEPLAWDSLVKEAHAKPGETNLMMTFLLTNVSANAVNILAVRPSCGCTVPRLPALPWRLDAGAHGQIDVAVDLRGKRGVLHKMLSVDTSAGTKYLTVRAIIPDTGQDNRSRNMMIAMANRQAIFKNDCASCHAHPTVGKKGEALYQAACGICHEAEHRASMVPDLTALKNPTSKEYWELWVTKGKPGTLMPAFAKSEGGPLDEEQVASLVDYLTHHYPPRPRVQAETPHHDD